MGDNQQLSGTEPAGIRWTFSDTAGCGIRAFGRPCQNKSAPSQGEANYPYSPLCRPGKEIVFVVEDEDDQRALLVELIEAMGYDVVGCADSNEFELAVQKAMTGCVILDIRLKGSDGVTLLERLKENKSVLSSIVVSGLMDPSIAAECMKFGAMEYLVKPVNEMALRRAIDKAIGLSRSNYCLDQSKAQIRQLLEKLTPAESKIAGMLAQGFPTKLIAGELGRSENTVKIHRHRIMSKIKVNSVASLANLYNHVKAG